MSHTLLHGGESTRETRLGANSPERTGRPTPAWMREVIVSIRSLVNLLEYMFQSAHVVICIDIRMCACQAKETVVACISLEKELPSNSPPAAVAAQTAPPVEGSGKLHAKANSRGYLARWDWLQH